MCWLIFLDPTKGKEQAGNRPALVVSKGGRVFDLRLHVQSEELPLSTGLIEYCHKVLII